MAPLRFEGGAVNKRRYATIGNGDLKRIQRHCDHAVIAGNPRQFHNAGLSQCFLGGVEYAIRNKSIIEQFADVVENCALVVAGGNRDPVRAGPRR